MSICVRGCVCVCVLVPPALLICVCQSRHHSANISAEGTTTDRQTDRQTHMHAHRCCQPALQASFEIMILGSFLYSIMITFSSFQALNTYLHRSAKCVNKRKVLLFL
uniref:Secreted protein n=1 Tax=Anguilla anguilla TaxID=7936 RepID=A0A0E9WSY5_ANGAN